MSSDNIPTQRPVPFKLHFASAISFTAGGLIPFAGAFAPTLSTKAWSIVGFTLGGLILTGVISAKTSGSKILAPTIPE